MAACERTVEIRSLRLTDVGPFSAIIEFSTDEPATFSVIYGEGIQLDRQAADGEAAREHRIVLTGLKPSTRYSYRVEPGPEIFSFRSAPAKDGAFDLVVVDGSSPLCQAQAADLDTIPDLIVTRGDCPAALADLGQSILISAIPKQGARGLTYGGWNVVLAPDVESAAQAEIDQQDAGRRRIVVLSTDPAAVPQAIEGSVVVTTGQVMYMGAITRLENPHMTRLEVDAFEVAAVIQTGRQRERMVVVQAPPETRKSCLYCDRLMESGRYEESLAWYRDFIATDKDSHEVENAFFQIARILDEKLFDYPKAIQAYRDFLQQYPKSRQSTIARYRLGYLQARSDHGFAPLERFERAKAELASADPLPAAAKVQELLKEYPDAAIADEALLWLGHLLQDRSPDLSRQYYSTLIERFPQSANAAMAAIAIGDTYYSDKHYRLAIAAYDRALNIVPDDYRTSVDEKLRKSRRNISREHMKYGAFALLAAWAAATLFWRPRPTLRDLAIAGAALAFYFLIGGVFFSITYERTRELIPTLVALSIGMSMVLFWNRALFSCRTNRRAWLLLLHSASCSLAVIYLVLYWFHYLYIFKI